MAEVTEVTFTTRISKKQYVDAMFALFWHGSRVIMIFIILFLTLNVTMNVITGLVFKSGVNLLLIYFILLGALIMPLLIWYRAVRFYNTNPRFRDEITFRISGDHFHIYGNTFDMKVDWVQYSSIRETRKFFLVFQGKGFAHILPKEHMPDGMAGQIREILKGVKVPVKKLMG